MTIALLVGTYQPQQEALAREHLEELALLADTYGVQVADAMAMQLRTRSAATYLTEGKLSELLMAIEHYKPTLVIFDDEISPAQQRNLERVLRVAVIDRAEVILGVFAQRAHTREAQLQVELAQGKYLAPRLKRMWAHLGQQRGGGGGGRGGGYLKGAGEKQLEVDKRLLQRRTEQLQREIGTVRAHRATQRAQRLRTGIPICAIVGYTNAGKSTVMRALTHADVLVENKLFATLDTTTRLCALPSHQQVLFIDTVGFIRKLPHHLIDAFRSTLEESVYADILLHVVDASSPAALDQAVTTMQVLHELGVGDTPTITLLNKMDRVTDSSIPMKLRFANPRCIDVTATTGEGLDGVLAAVDTLLKERRKRLHVRIPQSEYHLVSLAMTHGKIFERGYIDDDVELDVELPVMLVHQYEAYIIPLVSQNVVKDERSI